MVGLVARGPAEQARGGEVVGHPGEVVAGVRLGQQVGDGDVVERAGERVQAERVEDEDVGGDLRGGPAARDRVAVAGCFEARAFACRAPSTSPWWTTSTAQIVLAEWWVAWRKRRPSTVCMA